MGQINIKRLKFLIGFLSLLVLVIFIKYSEANIFSLGLNFFVLVLIFFSCFYLIVILIYIILKYNIYIGYLVALTLPFQSTKLFGLAISDICGLIWLLSWIGNFILGNIKITNLYRYKFVICFFIFSTIATLINMMINFYSNSIVELARLAISIFIGITIVSILNNKKKIYNYIYMLILGSFLASSYNLINLFLNGIGITDFIRIWKSSVQNFYQFKYASSLFFADPNNYAGYLMMCILINIGLIRHKKVSKFFNKSFLIVILVVQSLSFLSTLSRGAYIALVCTLLIYLLFTMKNIIKQFAILCFICIIPIAAYYIYTIFSSDISAMSRLGLWGIGIKMTLSNPFIGVGLANYTNLFYEYKTVNLLISNPYTHNLFLKISSELGLIGLFLFMLIYINPFLTKKLYLRKKIINNKLLMFLYLSCISFLIQAFSVEYFSSRYFWIITMLMLLITQSDYLKEA